MLPYFDAHNYSFSFLQTDCLMIQRWLSVAAYYPAAGRGFSHLFGVTL